MTKSKRHVINKLLEAWYTIDSILLNGHARHIIQDQKVFEDYIATKGALLSNLAEYYDRIKYSPNKSAKNLAEMKSNAVLSAKSAKKVAAVVLERQSTKDRIKKTIVNESVKYGVKNVSVLSDKIVQEKFLQAAIDNSLIGVALLESRNLKDKCGPDCTILEDAHKTIRSHLVRLAISCKKN